MLSKTRPCNWNPKGIAGFIRTQADINKAVIERLNAILDDVKVLKDDTGDIKGKHARDEVERDARLITFDLGVEYIREIGRDELARWAQKLSHEGIATQALRSFRKARLGDRSQWERRGNVPRRGGIVHGG